MNEESQKLEMCYTRQPPYYFRRRVADAEYEVGFSCLRELIDFVYEVGLWEGSGLGYPKEQK